METALALVPLAFLLAIVPAICAAFTLAAARLLRLRLKFLHAYLFGAATVVVALVGRLLSSLATQAPNIIVSIAAAMVVNVTLGAWFFGPRATDRNGDHVGPGGGGLLAGLGLLLWGLIAGGVAAAVSLSVQSP